MYLRPLIVIMRDALPIPTLAGGDEGAQREARF